MQGAYQVAIGNRNNKLHYYIIHLSIFFLPNLMALSKSTSKKTMHRQELNFLSALFSWPLLILQKSAPKKRIGKVYFLLPLFLGLFFSNRQPLKDASAKILLFQYSFFMAFSPIVNPQKMHRQKLYFSSIRFFHGLFSKNQPPKSA